MCLAFTLTKVHCVGVPSACEGAVHAMRRMYENGETEAILMVDASNAFNSLKRIAALHNMQSLCPPLARVFLNTYGKPIRLVVSGGGKVLSREGTCQGDPLATAIYVVSTVPLIKPGEEGMPRGYVAPPSILAFFPMRVVESQTVPQ